MGSVVAPLRFFWATFGAVLRHLVAALPPLGPRGSKRKDQEKESPKDALDRPREAQRGPTRPKKALEALKRGPKRVLKNSKESQEGPETN